MESIERYLTPIELWNYGIVSRAGQLTRFEEEYVRFALLRTGIATVSEQGIEFKGCYYSFSEALANKWFEIGRKRRFKASVSYDSRLVDTVYIHPLSGKGRPYLAHLTARSLKYKGLSFEEVAYYELLRAAVRLESGEQRLFNSVELAVRTEPTVNAAKKKLRAAGSGVTRTARRADIKPARQAERSIERQSLAKIDHDFSSIEKDGGAKGAAVTSVATPMPQPASKLALELAAARARMAG